ncbi:MAG: MAPEG family protein [Pseudomonadota bacterium]
MNPALATTFDQTAIFQPFAALLLLTLAVWVYLYIRRLSYMYAHRIDPQRFTTPDKVSAALAEAVQYPAYNLRNLSELPILFYALCLALFVLNRVDATYLELAWAFVGFRALHSAVHCTFNRVKLRFTFYLLASIALWIMTVRFALSVFA